MSTAEHGGLPPVAIVGIGCHLPGGATSPRSYWDLLCSDTDATRTVPETRWNAAKYYDPNPDKIGKMVTRRGGFLQEIDQFDAQFFGISPREANLIDPQQRLLLQTTWEALEDGGLLADELAGTDVGVFVGGFTLDYQLLQNHGRTSRYRLKTHSATGMMMTMLANRISFTFDFRGPSMTVDTACSSSLVAVHLAARSIWNGECNLALAGGVNIMIGPNTTVAESKSGFLSPGGRCKAFDASADGYARGEGGAVVVLKPLAQALRDGDDIYAQILGTAVSQDGHTGGITVPSGPAQAAAITTAVQRAGLRPNDISYVEAHGTGTPVGDPIELNALATALASDRPATDPLLIGSVKTNIGHLEAGAGVAGLIKTALILKHGYIPANLHLTEPCSAIPLGQRSIDIPRTGQPFPGDRRRVAGVNSFGFGGTNAHVVLAEAPVPASTHAYPPVGHPPPALLPISARTEPALAAAAHRLAEHLDTHPDLTLADLSYTLAHRRSHLTHRAALVADSISDARDQLRALAESERIPTGRASTPAPRLAFVCTGMGPQWWRMCRGLLDVYPAFTDSIERCDHELSRHTDWSLLDELRADETRSRMADTEVAQPANFALQIALAAQLNAFGVVPDAVVGHSAGEVAAHYLAGVLTFEQAVHVIYHRSRLQQRTAGLGRLLAVGLPADALPDRLDDRTRAEIGRRISIAAINGPSAVTLAGDTDVLGDVAGHLDDAGIFCRLVPGAVPYHSHHMDAVKDDLQHAFANLSSQSAVIPLYSTVTGERLDRYTTGAAYWWQNTRATVLFEPALRRMLDDGYTHFVELGPHPVLAASITETAHAQQTDVAVVATQRRGQDDAATLMDCLGALHRHGHPLAWDAIHPRAGGRLVKLPTYPWQTRRFWNETEEATEDLHYHPVHSLLGQPVSAVHPTWEAEFNTATIPFLADHQVQGRIVVPGAVYIEMALAAAQQVYGSTDYSVDNLQLRRAILLDDTCDPVIRTTLNEDTGAVEFAAFTTVGADLKWTITATAELSTLSRSPERGATPEGAAPHTTIDGDEFYAHAAAIGFGYGDAFQTITGVSSGPGWARAQVTVPAPIAPELDTYRFHPALIDAALQTLLGTPHVGHDTHESDSGPYLPTRIRRASIFRPPTAHMTAHVRVVSAGPDEIDSDITLTSVDGELLAVLTGFTVQSLAASSRMSPDRVDRGLYEIAWVPAPDERPGDAPDNAAFPDGSSWLIFLDGAGVGTALADQLRRRGHRVHTVIHPPVRALTEFEGGYAVNPWRPEQFRELLDTHLKSQGSLTGIINCWPMDIYAPRDSPPNAPACHAAGGHYRCADPDASETSHRLGVFPVLHLAKAIAAQRAVPPRLYLITANAQPAPGTPALAVDQAPIWGLGRVFGHQEFVHQWGALIDINDADNRARTAARICDHVLAAGPEDQIAIRGDTTYVARLRPSVNLSKAFPTKLTADATYLVTGGFGALGRIVATYLAERGARHIVVLSRTALPPRQRWAALTDDDPHRAAVEMIRTIERLGAHVSTAGVDITDADQVHTWLHGHLRDGGRPVRGIVHAAGVVDDQLLVNMGEDDFAAVMAPKVTGTRVLHNVFHGHDLEFFVMFGSAGSVIASPGQGNYAAANAFLDAFAHYRQAAGLPGLTIGWGPWSVGMVEELALQQVYAQRGIELITPAAGTRILDRLINQRTPTAVAISADWRRARRAGFGAELPPMFCELGAAEPPPDPAEAESSVHDVLSGCPEADWLEVVARRVRHIVAAVFDLAADDIGADDILDEIGLDSMMAVEFRVRIGEIFAVDLPVLELLRGVSVNSLAARILTELTVVEPTTPAVPQPPAEDVADGDEVERLIETLSDADLRELLAELEASPSEQDQAGPR